jgi:flagellar hook-associated protein 2
MAEIESARPARPTFGGLASGLDTGALVDGLMQIERIPLTKLDARLEDLKAGQSAAREFNTLVLELRNAARAIDNRNNNLSAEVSGEEFLSYTALSGDEGVLTAEAKSTAAPGSYSIEVSSLAAVARRVSIAYTDRTAALGAGSFEVDFGGDTNLSITLDADDTLGDLATAINDHADNDNNVRADVIFDGSGYRLVVQGITPGAANDVAITTSLTGSSSEPFIDATLGNDASDAALRYLGLSVTSDSNEISNLIPGVTITLAGTTATNETIELEVARDDTAITGKVQKLVDAFNAIHDFIEKQEGEPGKDGGPLQADSLLQTIRSMVRRVLGTQVGFGDSAAGDPTWASDIGIRFTRDGKLELNATTLKDRLGENPQLVRQLLSGTDPSGLAEEDIADADGVATALARMLEPVVDTTRFTDANGDKQIRQSFFKARENAANTRIRALETQIERFEDRLAKREEFLRRQFANLETLIASLQGQSSFLNRI